MFIRLLHIAHTCSVCNLHRSATCTAGAFRARRTLQTRWTTRSSRSAFCTTLRTAPGSCCGYPGPAVQQWQAMVAAGATLDTRPSSAWHAILAAKQLWWYLHVGALCLLVTDAARVASFQRRVRVGSRLSRSGHVQQCHVQAADAFTPGGWPACAPGCGTTTPSMSLPSAWTRHTGVRCGCGSCSCCT